MKIYKLALTAAVLGLTILTSTTALEVDEDEIRSYGDQVVTFENYMGPHAIIETADAIRSIGSNLGRMVNTGLNSYGEYNMNEKYAVIHAVDQNEKNKFDADIILINPAANVDHVTNLRRIIQGYLMASYGYNATDASTLATFVTVYNAVYRNQLKVFQDRYKNAVTRHLTQDKCGLSTKWTDWAGNSQVVIPLFDIGSNLSSVDTSVISDQNVIKSMREEDDRGVDERKNMVDIKEREAEDYSNKAQKSAEDAAEKNRALEQQQKKSNEASKDAQNAQKDASVAQKSADTAKKEAENAQKSADTAKKQAENAQKSADTAKKDADTAQKKADAAKAEAAKNPDDSAKQQAAQNAQKQADTAQKKADTAQKTADQKKSDASEKQNAAQKKAETAKEKENTATAENKKTEEVRKVAQEAEKKAADQQAVADKKQSEAQRERTEIAKDQQKLLSAALSDLDNKNSVVGLKLSSTDSSLSKMVRIDVTSGAVIRESPVSVIRGRTIYPVTASALSPATAKDANAEDESPVVYLAICGENSGKNAAVKLCQLDARKMEIQKESNEVVSEESVLVNNGNDYYCVIKNGNDWVVGKYDANVNLLLRSPVPVAKDTPIIVSDKGVVVTASSGQIVLLSIKDLTQITKSTTLTGIVDDKSAKGIVTEDK